MTSRHLHLHPYSRPMCPLPVLPRSYRWMWRYPLGRMRRASYRNTTGWWQMATLSKWAWSDLDWPNGYLNLANRPRSVHSNRRTHSCLMLSLRLRRENENSSLRPVQGASWFMYNMGFS